MIEKIKEKFGSRADIFEKNPQRIYVTVKKEDIKDIVSFIFNNLKGRLSIASGLDAPSTIEILYHMAMDKNNLMISVRSFADKPNPTFPSITPVIQGAEWIEREIHELLGVDFEGHPGLTRLLLSDDWPDDVYPLRKSYKPACRQAGQEKRET